MVSSSPEFSTLEPLGVIMRYGQASALTQGHAVAVPQLHPATEISQHKTQRPVDRSLAEIADRDELTESAGAASLADPGKLYAHLRGHIAHGADRWAHRLRVNALGFPGACVHGAGKEFRPLRGSRGSGRRTVRPSPLP